MNTYTHLHFPQLKFDSFYVALQRQRLRGDIFGAAFDDDHHDYEILGELGRGGMGIVYEARHHRLERTVAIKRVLDRRDPQLQRRLIAEAKAMAKVCHPNIVTVFDIETIDDTVLIVMEYVDGVTLGQWLERRQPAIRDILEVFIAAGEGLRAAHEAGLIHGDFKPSNVMIDRQGRARVMDFGLARTVAASSASDSMRPGGGTPEYMAPEQLAGQSADMTSDQYAFCVSLHRALWGERTGAGLREGQDWPRLAQIVRRGLRSDPHQRHRSMADLVEALRRELDDHDERQAPGQPQTGSAGAMLERLLRRGREERSSALGLLCVLAGGLLMLACADPPLWAPVIIPGIGLFTARPRGVEGTC